MTLSGWRIIKSRYVNSAWSGDGASQYPGRWNQAGIPAIYLAECISLAALELLVHLDSSAILQSYALAEARFDESLIGNLSDVDLPKNWREVPVPESTRILGTTWLQARTSVVMRVPSAVIPMQFNYLLNPEHVDFKHIELLSPKPFDFDSRLASKGS